MIRLSGPRTVEAVTALAGRLPAPRRASLRRLASDGEVLDEALVLWMPAPRSYTGEDSAELHLHGGPAVVDGVTRALLVAGLRLAEPGEFSRRAFENGRLDLAQAEAVADLVEAQTAAQASQALGQLGGALGERYRRWGDTLIDALSVLEAAIDFPDEDLPLEVASRARAPLEQLLRELDSALADANRGRQVRDGYRVALIGAPNAGKSSLLNALAGRDAVIVAPTPGTTRDVVEIGLVLQGYQVLLADTAGLRDAGEAVEVEGVRRARAWAIQADLRLWLVDAAGSDGDWVKAQDLAQPGDLLILNKADLPAGADALAIAELGLEGLSLSLSEDPEATAVRAWLGEAVRRALAGGEFPAATRARHMEELKLARFHVERALGSDQPELAAESARLAARTLARITGGADAEAVLDRVFSSFCIGK
ncbi:MAG: tRNA uridine-5-carboxymethylaminomethyl(34) synthesis GTPase MnmE [Caulobacteraceae bacterium]|nr:tRNA uridine-5-carboxymethylaminomethyl(34) synthesis GTPase MnmE [Caulobacteraceae bacterium]